MIITDGFVMLNLPKTGSTFARQVLKSLYKTRYSELTFAKKLAINLKISEPLLQEFILPNIRIKKVRRRRDQHGTYQQIPEKYKQREIFSIVRNPYERLLSVYEYKEWVKNPPISRELIAQSFPQFPELSLNEFIEMSKMIVEQELESKSPHVRIGPQSLQFIYMYFKNPGKVLQTITDDYIDSDKYLNDIADITFLRQEHLGNDMRNFLETHGFSHDELRIIDELGIVNETKHKSENRNALFTPEAIAYINTEERFILKILRQKGIEYPCPKIDYLKIPGGGDEVTL